MSPSKPLWEMSWQDLNKYQKSVRVKVLKIQRTMRNSFNKDVEALARQNGLRVDQVLENTNAIHKTKGGWEIDPTDTISRHWVIIENGEPTSIYVNDSKASSFISSYLTATKKLWRYGDETELKQFRGMSVKDEDSVEHFLETDREKVLEAMEKIENIETYEFYNKGGH